MPRIMISLHPAVIDKLTHNPNRQSRSAYARDIIISSLLAHGINLPAEACDGISYTNSDTGTQEPQA